MQTSIKCTIHYGRGGKKKEENKEKNLIKYLKVIEKTGSYACI